MIIPNELAQNRAMSYTARGLLVDLLSRPDDWRETCRQMADSSPQGRKALASALDELRSWGYYRVEVVRLPNGQVRSEAHIFDRPRLGGPPGATVPGSGEPERGEPGVLSKDLEKEPSLPAGEPEPVQGAPRVLEGVRGEAVYAPETPSTGAELTMPDEAVGVAVQQLLRAIRPERRLPLGEAEAAALAPLVRAWFDRGGTQEQLREALLGGLPEVVYSPAGVLRSRLERKMPADRQASPSGASGRAPECDQCRDPLAAPGLCARCKGFAASVIDREAAQVTSRGMARVRAALAGCPV